MRFRAYKLDGSSEWPNGPLNVCFMCEKKFQGGQVVFAAKSAQKGTVSFHKSCIKILAQLQTPKSDFEDLREEIHNGTDSLGLFKLPEKTERQVMGDE